MKHKPFFEQYSHCIEYGDSYCMRQGLEPRRRRSCGVSRKTVPAQSPAGGQPGRPLEEEGDDQGEDVEETEGAQVSDGGDKGSAFDLLMAEDEELPADQGQA